MKGYKSVHFVQMNWLSKSSMTMTMILVLFILAMLLLLFVHAVNSANFSEVFQPNWAPDHIVIQGDQISLSLDNTTGE